MHVAVMSPEVTVDISSAKFNFPEDEDKDKFPAVATQTPEYEPSPTDVMVHASDATDPDTKESAPALVTARVPTKLSAPTTVI